MKLVSVNVVFLQIINDSRIDGKSESINIRYIMHILQQWHIYIKKQLCWHYDDLFILFMLDVLEIVFYKIVPFQFHRNLLR